MAIIRIYEQLIPGNYEVVVDDIGVVYSGPHESVAVMMYDFYVHKTVGRAAGKRVMLIHCSAVVREHNPDEQQP